jgi:hypothetical protein
VDFLTQDISPSTRNWWRNCSQRRTWFSHALWHLSEGPEMWPEKWWHVISSKPSRIPIAAITGTNGKTTTLDAVSF